MSDLHGHFEDDFDGFRQFVSDAIAAHPSVEDNRRLEAEWIPLLKSILSLMEYLRQPAAGDEQTAGAREAEFRTIISSVASQGLSFEKLKSLASIFGFQGGQPGRPRQDYSAEYELRAKGEHGVRSQSIG